jgi:hypothetical protein
MGRGRGYPLPAFLGLPILKWTWKWIVIVIINDMRHPSKSSVGLRIDRKEDKWSGGDVHTL